MTMQEQLKKFTDSLKGIKLVKAYPGQFDGTMDLSLEVEADNKDPIGQLKTALEKNALQYNYLGLFPSVPKTAMRINGVRPIATTKPATTKTESQK